MDTFHFAQFPPNENVEQQVACVMTGNSQTIRQRLITAAQYLEYQLISDTPLRLRRAARKGGKHQLSANVLDYPCKVEIHLSSSGLNATHVVFDYHIQGAAVCTAHPTLTREAEAMMALANQLGQSSACTGCGAMLKGESRFCRKCGAPLSVAPPAELEVLRLTAGLRAGFDLICLGSILLSLLILLLIINKLVFDISSLLFLGILPGLAGGWAFLAGVRRLALTLKSQLNPSEWRLPSSPPSHMGGEFTSVAEGTTELLPSLSESEHAPSLHR